MPAGRGRALPPIWNGSWPNPFVKGFRRVLHVMPDELSESAAVPGEHQAAGGHRSDFRSLRAAASDSQGDRARRSCARCPVRPRPLRRARHQGRRRASVAGAYDRDRQAAERRGQDLRRGRLCRCRDWTVETLASLCRAYDRGRSAGTVSSGAATGPSARLAAGFRPGSRPRMRCLPARAQTRKAKLLSATRSAACGGLVIGHSPAAWFRTFSLPRRCTTRSSGRRFRETFAERAIEVGRRP